MGRLFAVSIKTESNRSGRGVLWNSVKMQEGELKFMLMVTGFLGNKHRPLAINVVSIY
jgi:hypothetical protein